jgi:hypothetical protein
LKGEGGIQDGVSSISLIELWNKMNVSELKQTISRNFFKQSKLKDYTQCNTLTASYPALSLKMYINQITAINCIKNVYLKYLMMQLVGQDLYQTTL